MYTEILHAVYNFSIFEVTRVREGGEALNGEKNKTVPPFLYHTKNGDG